MAYEETKKIDPQKADKKKVPGLLEGERQTVELISRYRSFNEYLETYVKSLLLEINILKYCLNEKRVIPLFNGTPKFYIIDIDILDKDLWGLINKIEKLENPENILFLTPTTIEAQVLKNALGKNINIVSKQESGKALMEYFYVFFGNQSYINWNESTENNPVLVSQTSQSKKLLSKREREIAQLIRSGMSSKEMVEFLRLSDSTISTYKRRLFDKLQVKNIVELVELEEEALFKGD